MAFKKIGFGGLGIALSANEHEAGLHFSVGGTLWRSLAGRLRRRRRRVDSEMSAASRVELAGAGYSPEQAALVERINAIDWYHTIDFGNGIKTPGRFDHAPILGNYGLPESFGGQRVLDVATFDGYWAFEFERRGAEEVYALDLASPADLDWPPKRRASATDAELALRYGAGFALASEQLHSKVRKVICNVYDLTPEKFGTFDVVHVGDVLLHLNSPVKALQNVARVCTGFALISDVYFPELDQMGRRKLLEYMGGRDGPTWWRISLSALEEMILDAGFSSVELLNTFSYGYRAIPGKWQHAVFRARK